MSYTRLKVNDWPQNGLCINRSSVLASVQYLVRTVVRQYVRAPIDRWMCLHIQGCRFESWLYFFFCHSPQNKISSTTRPRNCQSPLREEGDKAQDRRRLVLQIANHRYGRKMIKHKTVDASSSKLPITAAEEGGKAQDRRRLALQIANHRCG